MSAGYTRVNRVEADTPARRHEHSVAAVPDAPAARRYPSGRSGRVGLLVVVALLLAASAAGYYFIRGTGGGAGLNHGLITNNSYINGLYTNENTTRTAVVFNYVFQHLDDEVTVYPSENYYYFKLTMLGKTLSGDIHLDVLDRDSGVVSCGFVEKREDRSRAIGHDPPAWSREFGARDSLFVDRLGDFRYAVTYRGRRVIFNLYAGDTAAPVKARLTGDEIYVGPSFDESGLRFFLIFNKAINKLYWILNEDGFVPEDFSRFSSRVEIGDRTEFAFYLDSINNRKILIGVQRLNVAHNNWNDGPFDQLPDNYVKAGRVEIRKYLEAHLGYKPGTLDRYGNYLGREKEARAVISPYATYVLPEDLSFADSALAAGLSGSALYGVLTQDRFDLATAIERGYLKDR